LQGIFDYTTLNKGRQVIEMLKRTDYIEAMELLGFTASNRDTYKSEDIFCSYKGNSLVLKHKNTYFATSKIENAIRFIECVMQVGISNIPITAAINTRNLAQNLVRVRSSNVWAVGFNVKNKGDNKGDLVMQFKGKNGGAGELYIYYDVGLKDYRRLIGAPSVGHQFWVSIRNNYSYSKLSGNKRGVLPNAINNW
jgi:hypothetical protein